MPHWFLGEDISTAMDQARLEGRGPTHEQQMAYEAAYHAENSTSPRILSVHGHTASIGITGILTGAPNLMAKWFGGGNTTYAEIQAATAAANLDTNVRDIEYLISSPGGEASSEWLAAMESIAGSNKPTKAVVGTMAASAAYGLASQANTITAQNEMSMVGSLGVMTSRYVDPGVVNITSTDAPNKRPDVTTDEGKATIRAELDAMHEIFANSVAKGRGVSLETVNTKFGRGGMLLASEAVAAGMIDSVKAGSHTSTAAVKSGTEGVVTMDLVKLKAEHPAVYALCVAAGIAEERERVVAHLTMGEAAGAINIALTAIKDGTSSMSPAVSAQYFAASLSARDVNARKADDALASQALEGAANTSANVNSDEDQVLAIVSQRLGLEA